MKIVLFDMEIPEIKWWRHPLRWFRRWRAIRYVKSYKVVEEVLDSEDE